MAWGLKEKKMVIFLWLLIGPCQRNRLSGICGAIVQRGSTRININKYEINTPVAQLVEQRSPKPQVAGSSPARRAREGKIIKNRANLALFSLRE